MLYVMLFCEYPFERPEDSGDPHRFQKVRFPVFLLCQFFCAFDPEAFLPRAMEQH